MRKQRIPLLLALLLLPFGMRGQQTHSEEPLRPILSATTLEVGRSTVYDTYLSNNQYRGYTLGLGNERMQVASYGNNHIIKQQLTTLDIARGYDEAGLGATLSGFVSYAHGWLYRFDPIPNLRILAGGEVGADLGGIYNLRNSNNPANAKASLHVGASAMALYTLRIKNYPITLRYQGRMPLMGALFSPNFQQSYYEIFELGNYHNVVHFASFHNQFDLHNTVTLDFPLKRATLRVGYRNTLRTQSVNGLESHLYNNTLLLGYVLERVSSRRTTQPIRSAYY